mmetsp:Transcript_2835/g.3927  ORF Transcript_2835/g.3927 Transcript_2835/m.3927 type:complete len:163 (-) Transcript_2835:267-755(-)
MAGSLAISVLILSVVIGIVLGKYQLNSDRLSGKPPKLIVLSVTTGIVSLIFLIWAIVNYVQESFDLGVFTFSLALGASLYGSGSLDQCVPLSTESYRLTSFSGYGAVAANYMLGLIYKRDDIVFSIYCVLGFLVWATAFVIAALIAKEGGLAADAPIQYSQI